MDYGKLDLSHNPHNPRHTWRHFRTRQAAERDAFIAAAIGDMRAFERHMHEGQDSFSHKPGLSGALSHVWNSLTGNCPDNPTRPEFQDADKWTHEMEEWWDFFNPDFRWTPPKEEKGS